VTSLGADHLDWHGTLEEYRRDKLSLTRAPGEHRTLVPENATMHDYAAEIGGDVMFVAPDETGLASSLGLLGAHNDTNVALALHCAARLATGASTRFVREPSIGPAFEPLRGRLTAVTSEVVDGVTTRYVDDGLATSALPVVAALEVFDDEPVALIVEDRPRRRLRAIGEAIAARRQPMVLITMGEAGKRLATR